MQSNKYTHEQALEIAKEVVGLPHGDNTYDVVHINGSVAVVHHHNNAESIYSHLRGVVIDLDDRKLVTKSVMGSIATFDIRDFRDCKGTITEVYCGVDGVTMKIIKYKGTVYYVTNRRIYTSKDRDDVIYVKYVMSILEGNPSRLFPNEKQQTAPYYHEFILVNRATSHLTSIDIPENGFLVYLGTRVSDPNEFSKDKDSAVIAATEFYNKGRKRVPVSSRYIFCNRRRYRPVSTIYPAEALDCSMEAIDNYLDLSKEFCIVMYLDDQGYKRVVRICHPEYLYREMTLQFSDNHFRRYISMCKAVPLEGSKYRVERVNKYISSHRIYEIGSADAILKKMKRNEKISYVKRRDTYNAAFAMSTDEFLINAWIDIYSVLPKRNKSNAFDLYSKYTTMVSKIYDILIAMLDGKTVNESPKVIELLSRRLEDIKEHYPKETAFNSSTEYREYIIKGLRNSIIKYTKIEDMYTIAEELNII